jgi:hypothetical protein
MNASGLTLNQTGIQMGEKYNPFREDVFSLGLTLL